MSIFPLLFLKIAKKYRDPYSVEYLERRFKIRRLSTEFYGIDL